MTQDAGDIENFETVSFHCRSPIHLCPTCSHAEKCQDLLNILRIFKLKEKEKPFDFMTNFPFLEQRTFKVDSRNKMNELSSAEWLQFSRTVFSPKLPKMLGHELRRAHPECKSPHVMGQLISFFTKRDDLVIDPFAGTGATLIAAALLGRDAVGFETSPRWVDLYYQACKQHTIPRRKMVEGDCSVLLHNVSKESVDFAIIDPPNPMNPSEWAPGAESSPGVNLDSFFDFMLRVMNQCYRTLKDQKYMAVFSRNLYYKGRYIYITPFYASVASEAGFTLKGEKIWENLGEKLRPYGYPHTYIPNIVHYSILIFRKTESAEEVVEEKKIKAPRGEADKS